MQKRKKKRKEKRRGTVKHEKILKRHIYQLNIKCRTCSDPDLDEWTVKRYFGDYWEKLNMDWIFNYIKELL